MHRITVLSKEGCHLCERAIRTLEEISTAAFSLEVVDISKDSSLEEYLLRIPVVLLDDKIVFEAEDIASPEDCRSKLSGLVATLR